jgi:hypothetical protein
MSKRVPSENPSLKQYMRLRYPNLVELFNTRNHPSMVVRATSLLGPVHLEQVQEAVELSTLVDHKENTDD